jgi:hypothetical protein
VNVFKVAIITLACVFVLLISGTAYASAPDGDYQALKEALPRIQSYAGVSNNTVHAAAIPVWPAGSKDIITSEYGWRIHPIYGDTRFHYGLDIGVDEGTPVVAPLSGTIKLIEWSDAVGFTVEIDHGGGIITRYCHLSAFNNSPKFPQLNSYAGMSVAQGQMFALSGNTGYLSTGAHLHFEVYDMNHSNNDVMTPPAGWPPAPTIYYRCWTVDPLVWLATPEPIAYSSSGFPLLYNYGDNARIWNMNSSAGAAPSVTPVMAWWSGYGIFDATKCNILQGDFNGDGYKDIAVVYDYGNAETRIWTLMWNGTGYTSNEAWASGPGNFNRASAKFTVTDCDGDNADDIVALYDYGNATSRLWKFKSNGQLAPSFTPSLAWAGAPGTCDAGRITMVSGNFLSAYGKQAALLYDNGNGTANIWTIALDTPSPVPFLAWSSGPGFSASRTKVSAGNYDGDTRTEVAVLYDYGAAAARVWTLNLDLPGGGAVMQWYSGPGNFDAAKARIITSDFGGDAKDDIGVLYDYGASTARIWLLLSSGTTMTPRLAWYSGPGNCAASCSIIN